jgi:hypothetical protein
MSDSRSLGAYCEPSPGSTDVGESSREEEQPPRSADLVEMLHIINLACVQWERRWQGPPLKESLMNGMVFDMVANSVLDKGQDDSLTVQLYAFDCLPSSHRL